MATSTTRLGIRRVAGTDLFKPYTVDLPSIVDTIDAKAVQFRSALAAVQVRDVGEVGQIRAGRVLAPADFTAMGLVTPVGLWNLSNVNDSSGNARTLTNKGTVPFGPGITGGATEAAIFAGSTSQALYIADTGAADPFRIRTGSFGAWFRTAKRGTQQMIVSKHTATAFNYDMRISAGNVLGAGISIDGTTVNASAVGATDVCDDRWHHGVVTYDGGRIRVYVDGVLDGGPALLSGALPAVAAPLNIGGFAADAATLATNPHYGRIDVAFVTSDVLSPEQVLNLYCARIAHTMTDGTGAAAAPTGARIGARRQKRGGALATGNFPAQPVRLHNFTAGALTDAGSGGVSLAAVGGGTIVAVAGADGVRDGAQSFAGAHTGLGATDTGLPATTASRSYGCWLKTTTAGTRIMGWGTYNTADATLGIGTGVGAIFAQSGADIAGGPSVSPSAIDGAWHHALVVEDNAAADGVKRKLYFDGRLAAGSTVLTSLTLAGANRFRVGSAPDGTAPFIGQIDGAFIYAGALTAEQVRAVYNAGSQALAASPKAEGDHVEALEATGLLAHFDTLEGCDLVDMSVVG